MGHEIALPLTIGRSIRTYAFHRLDIFCLFYDFFGVRVLFECFRVCTVFQVKVLQFDWLFEFFRALSSSF